MKLETTDDRIVLVCAFRYALGRKTYTPTIIADTLIANWGHISDGDKALYKREIEDAIDRQKAGMDCDVETWKRILELK